MGSKQPIAPHPQVQLTNVGNIELQHRSDSPWGEVLISDGRNRVTLISAPLEHLRILTYIQITMNGGST